MVVEHGCSLVRVQLPRGSPGGNQGVSAGPGRQVRTELSEGYATQAAGRYLRVTLNEM